MALALRQVRNGMGMQGTHASYRRTCTHASQIFFLQNTGIQKDWKRLFDANFSIHWVSFLNYLFQYNVYFANLNYTLTASGYRFCPKYGNSIKSQGSAHTAQNSSI